MVQTNLAASIETAHAGKKLISRNCFSYHKTKTPLTAFANDDLSFIALLEKTKLLLKNGAASNICAPQGENSLMHTTNIRIMREFLLAQADPFAKNDQGENLFNNFLQYLKNHPKELKNVYTQDILNSFLAESLRRSKNPNHKRKYYKFKKITNLLLNNDAFNIDYKNAQTLIKRHDLDVRNVAINILKTKNISTALKKQLLQDLIDRHPQKVNRLFSRIFSNEHIKSKDKNMAIDLLLENGADINKKDKDDKTVLYYTQSSDRILRYLQLGADPTISSKEKDEVLQTSLSFSDLYFMGKIKLTPPNPEIDKKIMSIFKEREKQILAQDRELIFAGSHEAEKQDWNITNRFSSNRFNGGLWSSLFDPETGQSEWQNWCVRNEHYPDLYKNSYHIIPDKDCRILLLQPHSPEIIKYLKKDDTKYASYHPDFEAITKDYDAVYIPEDARLHYYWFLCGYDVASYCFLKPKFKVMTHEEYVKYLYETKGIKRSPEYYCSGEINIVHPSSFEELQASVSKFIENNISNHHSQKSVQNTVDDIITREIFRTINCIIPYDPDFRAMETAENLSSNLSSLDILLHYQHKYNPKSLQQCLFKKDSYNNIGELRRESHKGLWQNNALPLFELLIKYGIDPQKIEEGLCKEYNFTSPEYRNPDINEQKIHDDIKDIAQNLPQDIKNKNLQNALNESNLKSAKYWLSAGADANMTVGKFKTPLLHLAKDEHQTDLLFKFGANPQAVNCFGQTALFYAKSPQQIEVLFENGVDPSHKDNYGKNATNFLANKHNNKIINHDLCVRLVKEKIILQYKDKIDKKFKIRKIKQYMLSFKNKKIEKIVKTASVLYNKILAYKYRQ